MRRSQYQTPNGCQQAEAPLSLTANPASQYNFMYCWQACLPNFVQAIHFHFNTFYSIYLFHHFSLRLSSCLTFVTHQALSASSLRLHSFQSFQCSRSSAPAASTAVPRFFKVGFGQSSCSSRPRTQSRNGDFVPSCDWWLEAERSCTTSKNTQINRTKWNQMESEYHIVIDK